MAGGMFDRLLGAIAPAAMPCPAGTVRLRALRPFWFSGRTVETGGEVNVPAASAADIIFSSRAEIVDGEQWAEIHAAVSGDNLRFERESRKHRSAGRN